MKRAVLVVLFALSAMTTGTVATTNASDLLFGAAPAVGFDLIEVEGEGGPEVPREAWPVGSSLS